MAQILPLEERIAAAWSHLPVTRALKGATGAIRQAIDRLPGGGRVIIEGTHTIDEPVKIPSGIWISGDDHESTISLSDHLNCHFFVNSDQNAGNTDIALTGLTFTSNMDRQEVQTEKPPAALACGFYGRNLKRA